MANILHFIAILWQFQGEKKKISIRLCGDKKNILVELQSNILLMKIIYFLSIIVESVA